MPDRSVVSNNFLLCIGAAKAGTTTLAEVLGDALPDLSVHREKEPSFFAGLCSEAAYARGFRSGAAWLGDFSTSYAKRDEYPRVAERAAALIGGELRLLYMVRNPVDQIVSHYRHLFQAGLETRPLLDALRDNPRYRAYASYVRQLEPWLDHFDESILTVVDFDCLRTLEGQRLVAATVAGQLRLPHRPTQMAEARNRAEDRSTRTHPLVAQAIKTPLIRNLRARLGGGPRRVLRTLLASAPAKTASISDAERERLADQVADLTRAYEALPRLRAPHRQSSELVETP